MRLVCEDQRHTFPLISRHAAMTFNNSETYMLHWLLKASSTMVRNKDGCEPKIRAWYFWECRAVPGARPRETPSAMLLVRPTHIRSDGQPGQRHLHASWGHVSFRSIVSDSKLLAKHGIYEREPLWSSSMTQSTFWILLDRTYGLVHKPVRFDPIV